MMPDNNPFVTGLQDFAQSQNYGGLGGLVQLGLGLTGNAGQPSSSDAAVAQGMSDFSKELAKSKGDYPRAMINFSQSPEGHKLMKVPGAFKKFTDMARENMTSLPPQTGQIGQGNMGTVAPGGGAPNITANQPTPQITPTSQVGGAIGATPGKTGNLQTPAPQINNVPPGNQALTATAGQGGKPGSTGNLGTNPTEAVQTFSGFASLSNLDQNTLGQMSGLNAGQNDLARRFAMGGFLKNAGVDQSVIDQWNYGFVNIVKDDKIPGRFYWTDQRDPTQVHPIQLNVGGQQGTSLTPTWNNGLQGANPQDVSSTPPRMNAQPGAQPGNAGPAAPNMPFVQQMTNKYNVPGEAIKADGTIDPVKAWGPAGTYVLGGGLPAMAQNVFAHMARWFDPRATSEGSEQVIQAEQGLAALKYLSTGLAEGSRVKVMVEAALGMQPEHEAYDDPASAAGQLALLRTTLEGQARVEQDALRSAKGEGVAADNSVITDSTKKLIAIQQVLNFLPSTRALMDEKKAIQDGKIANVPSVGTAAREGAGVAGQVVQHATKSMGAGNADSANADAQRTIERISAAKSPKELSTWTKMYGKLDPVIQQAVDDKMNEFRNGARRTAPQAAPNTFPNPNMNTFGNKPVQNMRTQPGNPFSSGVLQ